MWITKSKLREQLTATATELRCKNDEIAQLRAYITKCENLLDHERSRIDAERERADRVTDAMLQSSGLPPVTSMGVDEARFVEREAKSKFAEQQKILASMYAESMDDLDSDEELTKFLEPIKELVNGDTI